MKEPCPATGRSAAEVRRGERARYGLILAAAFAIGAAAVILARLGNPPNMGICSACSLRDTAGGLCLFSGPGPLQCLRPEIPGFVLGAFAAALLFGGFASRGGSAPALRFVMGALIMAGALVFLGCPIRMLLRLGGGDFAAAGAGLLGVIAGAALGSAFIARGFSLGPGREAPAAAGLMAPLLAAMLAAFILFLALGPAGDPRGLLATTFQAPLFAALGIALVAGVLAERSGFCSVGGYRDALLWRDYRLLSSYAVFLAAVAAGNLLFDLVLPGPRRLFAWGAAPLAHGQHLWNFAGMLLVGLGSVLAGGCPFRQMIAAGQGSADGLMTVLGLLAGAAICHNFGLAAAPATAELAGGPPAAGRIAVIAGIVFLIVIGAVCRQKQSAAAAPNHPGIATSERDASREAHAAGV